MNDELTSGTRQRILDLMGQGFFDDEICDLLLQGIEQPHRDVVGSYLRPAIRSIRVTFRRPGRGRPKLSMAVLQYRWQQAAERAGSEKIRDMARHYRIQRGEIGLDGERLADDENALQSRMRHLREVRKRLSERP